MSKSINNFNWVDDTWKVVKTLITKKLYLVQHQVSSFNEFLDKGLPNIISQFNTRFGDTGDREG